MTATSSPTSSHGYAISLGKRISKARSSSGMTQTELGHRLGLCRASVTAIEMGRQRVNAERLIELGRILRVDPGWLLRGDLTSDPLRGNAHTANLIHARAAVERLLRAHADAFHRDADRLTQLASDLYKS